jgi:hypothetical protein
MWEIPIILANQPDIVLHAKKKTNCLLTEIAVPDDTNFNTEETEKLSKYNDLEINISRKWKLGTKTVAVITGILATFREGLDHSLQVLSGPLSAIEPQKVILMSTAHSIGKCWGKRL